MAILLSQSLCHRSNVAIKINIQIKVLKSQKDKNGEGKSIGVGSIFNLSKSRWFMPRLIHIVYFMEAKE